ncbi:hypothetical protein ACJX0J_013259, partial [Zea mays]
QQQKEIEGIHIVIYLQVPVRFQAHLDRSWYPQVQDGQKINDKLDQQRLGLFHGGHEQFHHVDRDCIIAINPLDMASNMRYCLWSRPGLEIDKLDQQRLGLFHGGHEQFHHRSIHYQSFHEILLKYGVHATSLTWSRPGLEMVNGQVEGDNGLILEASSKKLDQQRLGLFHGGHEQFHHRSIHYQSFHEILLACQFLAKQQHLSTQHKKLGQQRLGLFHGGHEQFHHRSIHYQSFHEILLRAPIINCKLSQSPDPLHAGDWT